jgi:xanthine/uracil permease
MLVLGFDVAILMILGLVLTAIAAVMACLLRMSREQGDVLICSVFMTGFVYVVAYVVMTQVLDRLV